ncbi:hypothetical protein ACQPYH_18515 [Kribbella sp. CA-245084]|uniref:hypothetical protein n=1 Tax=Kribbella sp. CA-245084 TaxID=3239940 RepID=UPI003D8E2A50
MRIEVRNRVTMSLDLVVAEVAPSRGGRRAWMMIRPSEDGRIMLVEFEHDAALDTDSWPAPDDIVDRRRMDFDTLDEVIEHLSGRGVETDRFDAPWKVDYPL